MPWPSPSCGVASRWTSSQPGPTRPARSGWSACDARVDHRDDRARAGRGPRARRRPRSGRGSTARRGAGRPRRREPPPPAGRARARTMDRYMVQSRVPGCGPPHATMPRCSTRPCGGGSRRSSTAPPPSRATAGSLRARSRRSGWRSGSAPASPRASRCGRSRSSCGCSTARSTASTARSPAAAARPTSAGMLDFVADFVVYGGFVVGVAVAVPDARVACCALLAAYLLNNVALLSFASLIEKRRLSARRRALAALHPGADRGHRDDPRLLRVLPRPEPRGRRGVGVLRHGHGLGGSADRAGAAGPVTSGSGHRCSSGRSSPTTSPAAGAPRGGTWASRRWPSQSSTSLTAVPA